MDKNKTYTDQIEENVIKSQVKISLEDRMRILANMMIDRILTDHEKGQLKFVSENSIVIMEHKKQE